MIKMDGFEDFDREAMSDAEKQKAFREREKAKAGPKKEAMSDAEKQAAYRARNKAAAEAGDPDARKKAAADRVRREHLHKCGRLGARDGRGLPIHWAGHYLAVAGHDERAIRVQGVDVFGDHPNVHRHIESTIKALKKKGLLA
jgi:hypothetical protein